MRETSPGSGGSGHRGRDWDLWKCAGIAWRSWHGRQSWPGQGTEAAQIWVSLEYLSNTVIAWPADRQSFYPDKSPSLISLLFLRTKREILSALLNLWFPWDHSGASLTAIESSRTVAVDIIDSANGYYYAYVKVVQY
jgi:hypothetical protein